MYNAIVWCDGRTKEICENYKKLCLGNINYFKNTNGLPISTYFSAFKIKWFFIFFIRK